MQTIETSSKCFFYIFFLIRTRKIFYQFITLQSDAKLGDYFTYFIFLQNTAFSHTLVPLGLDPESKTLWEMMDPDPCI
jgi:hypothetical protein